MNPDLPRKNSTPYSVKQTPRGSVVVCGEHLVTDEVKTVEAEALARSLNAEYRKLMIA
jgi:hypothetical protein